MMGKFLPALLLSALTFLAALPAIAQADSQ